MASSTADGILSPQELAGVRAMLARQEIRDCLHRYTRGVDRVDADLIRSAFHPDAIDYHGPVTGSVEDFLNYWLPLQDAREISQHYIHNHAVDVDGDSAHAETYFTWFNKMKGLPEMNVAGGRYIDHFERRKGEWKISVRIVSAEWQCVANGELTDKLTPTTRARRGAADLSYLRPLTGLPSGFS